MKIYNKSAFGFGVFCAIGLLFFALDIISADWWQWIITIAISGRYLYIGLSKTASERDDTIRQSYNKTATRLYGKHAFIKTNLPIILLVIFFVMALFIRFGLNMVIPASAAVVFCILLTISVAYSVGLDRSIKNAIMDENGSRQEKQ